MKQKVIILFANQYEMTDEKTGERKNGTSIMYIFNTDLECMDNSDGSKGMRSAKSSSDYMLMHKVRRAPAMYEAEFSMKIGSDGKPVLKIEDLEYVADVVVSVVDAKVK